MACSAMPFLFCLDESLCIILIRNCFLRNLRTHKKNMMHKYVYIICLLLSVTFAQMNAQIFQYIGIEDGLSSRRVLSLQQGEHDYIWILTHKGIDRYNGKQFTHYPLIKNGVVVSCFPNLNTLKTDKEQRVWEIGKDGLVFTLDEAQDSFQLIFDLHARFPETQNVPITCTYMDDEKNIWFCTEGHQYIYNGQNKKTYKISQKIPGKVTCITQAHGNKYFISNEQHLYSVTFQNGQLENIQKVNISPIHIIDYIYYHKPTRKLIINALLDKLFIYTPTTGELTDLGDHLKDIGVNTIIPNRKNSEEVFIATDGDGVYKLNVTPKQLSHFLEEDNESLNKMNGSIIKDIYMDRTNRIWNVIYPIGITIYSERYPQYQWYKHAPNNPNTLPNDCINGIMEDSDGDVWYATSNGVSCFNSREKKWKNYCTTEELPNYENHIFLSVCEIKPGIILAGGYMSGIFRIEKNTGKVTFHQQGKSPIRETPDKYIRGIIVDKEGVIWSGGFYSLKGFDTRTFEKQEYNSSYPITFLLERDANSLWVGTIHGLYVFDKKKKQLLPYQEKEEIGCVNAIYSTSDLQKTYVGTYGNGLFIVDNQTQEITHCRANNSGLQTNNIYSIVPDRNENLFLGTENGLSFYNRKDHTFTNWTREQGLQAANFNSTAGLHTRDGHLIFGSNEGVIILSDSLELPSSFSSHMVFSNLQIMYHPVHPMDPNSPLTKILDETNFIQLKYNQNTFSMEVSSINFDNPSSILYSWKLEGFYDQWTPPTSNGTIRYTNLSPGNYTLKVRSILLDNQQVLEEREIEILVERPFWLTFWAFLFYALLIIGAAYTFLRYQIIKRERKTSEEKINFFTHAAHDIRTPLTMIKAPLGEIMEKEKLSENGQKNIRLAMESTENLAELANNLINFQKEELYSSQTIVTEHELNHYLSTYLHQFESFAQQKDIQLSYESTFPTLQVWIDVSKMDSILRNLLSNALKYTPQGGKVSMKADANKNTWMLTISDTGIGMNKEEQKKLFKYLFRGHNATNQTNTGCGIGMLLTYRLIENHEGKITFNSTENVGTSFQLSFPIRSKNYQYKKIRPDTEKQGLSVMPSQAAGSGVISQFEVSPTQTDEYRPLILVVEDNAPLRSFIQQSLSDTYQTEGVENGKEAIEFVQERQPDLILSDIMMPVMDGREMCQRLKGNMETSHIPIILLTALGDKEHILEGLEIKADQYLVKPFDVHILKATIHTLLENRKMLRSRFRSAVTALPEEADTPIELPTTLDDEFIQKVTELVKEGLGKNFNVDTLCASVNMSRTSFYNKIKALTGIAPAEFIRNIRMQEAALMLKSQRYTVAEVSDKMGFADPKYFTDTFKKFYGVPPSIYMKKN